MIQGIRTVIYPIKDLAQAKALYSKLLGVKPYAAEAYGRALALCGNSTERAYLQRREDEMLNRAV